MPPAACERVHASPLESWTKKDIQDNLTVATTKHYLPSGGVPRALVTCRTIRDLKTENILIVMLKRIQLFDDSKAETYCTAAEIYKFDTHRSRKGFQCLCGMY